MDGFQLYKSTRAALSWIGHLFRYPDALSRWYSCQSLWIRRLGIFGGVGIIAWEHEDLWEVNEISGHTD